MCKQERRKKSSFRAKDTYDYRKLMVDTLGLLPCDFVDLGEDILFTYYTEGKKPLPELQKESKEAKYQFLINLALLDKTRENYFFSMTEDNLWYDENYLPFVKDRDIYEWNEEPEESKFLEAYQTIVSGILGEKYTVQQIAESGLEILKGEKGYDEILNCKSVWELQKLLREKKSLYQKKEKSNKRSISKKAYLAWRIMAVLGTVGFLSTGIFSVYASSFRIPQLKAVIDAHESYVKKDYVGCIDSLQKVSPEDMDASTRYVLAVSYASSESFQKDEIQTIVEKLSSASNEKELNYWIYLGRLDMKKAEELAMSLSDDKLLIYAYMKEADILESDNTINGEEKKKRLDTLEQEIKTIGEKYEETENTMQ